MNPDFANEGRATPLVDLSLLLRSLQPQLNDGVYVFASLPLHTDLAGMNVIATFREREGCSVIVAEDIAHARHLPILFRAAWITLSVNSDLHAVGLTAAVSTALTKAGISCNMVAAACHDHVFVPCELAQCAMNVLRDLQRRATTA